MVNNCYQGMNKYLWRTKYSGNTKPHNWCGESVKIYWYKLTADKHTKNMHSVETSLFQNSQNERYGYKWYL